MRDALRIYIYIYIYIYIESYNTRLPEGRDQEPTQSIVRDTVRHKGTHRIPGWQFTAVRNLHHRTCGMLCEYIERIEYQVNSLPTSRTYITERAGCSASTKELSEFHVDSLPPSGSYTTSRAGCFANTQIIQRIPGWQFTAITNLHNSTCGMLGDHVKPTEYKVNRLPPSGTYTTPRAGCFANI